MRARHDDVIELAAASCIDAYEEDAVRIVCLFARLKLAVDPPVSVL